MKNNLKRKNQLLFAAISGILSAAATLPDAQAGAYQEVASLFDHNGIVVGGWANGGVTYNGNEPQNNFNGTSTFGDRANEFQMNQLNVYVQRAVATEGNKWDFGGRFDFMYGTDSIFTQAYGVPAFNVNSGVNGQYLGQSRSEWDLTMLGSSSNRFYDIALPQAYLESYVPIGNGINLKIGHFYTPIGYESVPAPDNFFYTHAYTMQFGEPFTHTGLMANYTVNDNLAVMGGLLTGSATGGWDGGWDKDLSNWSGLMGATVTSNDKNTSLNISGTYGMSSASRNSAPWGLYSVVLKHNVTDKFHLVLQHDHGFADNYFFADGSANGINKDAEWYGINSHFIYDVSDKVTAGIRAEWFRDQDGVRVCAPGRVAAATDPNNNSYAAGGASNYSTCGLSAGLGATYYEFTAGVTWKPKDWIRLRPNVRYDLVGDAHGYSPFVLRGNGFTPGQAGQTVNSQIIFSTDVTVTF